MFMKRLGVPMYSSHRYRLSVTYVNPTGKVIPDGGMAEVGGIVYPEQAWPSANPRDAMYVADYKLQTKKPATSGGTPSLGSMDMKMGVPAHTH
jgi:hypothetical protein